MTDQVQENKAAALKAAIFASLALACMLVDFVCLIRDEVKYVWPKVRSSWTARMFILTRYVGLAGQVFNIYFAVRMYLGVYTSATGCRLWFSFQAIVVQFLLFSVEALLMHRIYALFLRSRIIAFVLIMFSLVQVASMFVSAKLVFPTNDHSPTCLIQRSNPRTAFFSATTMTTNIAIFFMTFWRHLRLPTKWQQGLGRVVFRDSAISLSAISAIMLFLTLCSLEVIKPMSSGNITYYWLVAVLWVSVGRIIVNHEKIQQVENEKGESTLWKEALQITSQIELGENTLTLGTEYVPELPS